MLRNKKEVNRMEGAVFFSNHFLLVKQGKPERWEAGREELWKYESLNHSSPPPSLS